MTIEAKVIADSIGPRHPRLTTFELRYPRFIHAEFMTHRMFSRNASSSRAIPVERQIQAIIEDTAMPIHWGANQKGMQAHEETDSPVAIEGIWDFDDGDGRVDYMHTDRLFTAEGAWLEARDRAIEVARGFVEAGYHKQVVNRILEPFSHIKVVCTATNFENFFWLRRHPDAQPEIKALADAMYDALNASEPEVLSMDQWHIPYVLQNERDMFADKYADGLLWKPEYGDDTGVLLSPQEIGLRVSVARCARVSYKTHDGRPSEWNEDMVLYHRLVGSTPLHASPAEHQAKLDDIIWNSAELPDYARSYLSGNFDPGWIQYRKTLDGEHMPSAFSLD